MRRGVPTFPVNSASPTSETLGYVRVSTEDQAGDQHTSLEDQRRAIVARAEKLGRCIDHVFEDPGASGATAEGRPGFMALLQFCEAHPKPDRHPGYVLVLNDSRWGRFRDPEEATYWRFTLKRYGWHVRFAEGDDTEDPLARTLLRGIHSAQASAYRETIRANAKRGARGTAAQGYWQNEAPIGYRRQAEAANRTPRVLEAGQRKADDEKVRLVPGPAAEQDLVRWVFATYASGTASLGSLARELHLRWPAPRWSRQGIGTLLKNPAYAGHVVWCRRPHDALERTQQRVRPQSEWVVAEHAHPALVSQALFDAVQQRLQANHRELRSTSGGYALSGLLHCAHCGDRYIGAGGPRGPATEPDRYRFYRCRRQNRVPSQCPGPSGILPRRVIDAAVVGAVAQVVSDPVVQRLIAEELDRTLKATGTHTTDRRTALERERRAHVLERDRIVDAIGKGVLTAEDAQERLAVLRAAITQAGDDDAQLQFARRRAEGFAAEKDRLLTLASDFAGIARRLDGVRLREHLRPWIENAVVDLVTRRVRLAIRRIPAAGLFVLSSSMPERD